MPAPVEWGFAPPSPLPARRRVWGQSIHLAVLRPRNSRRLCSEAHDANHDRQQRAVLLALLVSMAPRVLANGYVLRHC